MIPNMVFFTTGIGKHREKLSSFEFALRDAGIERFNLVRVSSIFPPYCTVVPNNQGLKYLEPGEIVYVVLSEAATNEPRRLLGASVGLARPMEVAQHGYISEHHAFGVEEKKIADYVEDLAATMLASTLGIDFNPDAGYDERKEIYLMSGQMVDTESVVVTAHGEVEKWVTAIAAAVFVGVG